LAACGQSTNLLQRIEVAEDLGVIGRRAELLFRLAPDRAGVLRELRRCQPFFAAALRWFSCSAAASVSSRSEPRRLENPSG
jgi:hypothetical protein